MAGDSATLSVVGASGAVVAAVAATIYTWLTYRLLVLQRRPVVIVHAAIAGGNANVTEVHNTSQVAAVNIWAFHEFGTTADKEKADHIAWLDALGPDGTVKTSVFQLKSVDLHPHYIFYQDTARRWYGTRVAMTGASVSSIYLGRRWWFQVPKNVREFARGETAVQYFVRLRFWQAVRHPIQWYRELNKVR